MPNTAVMQKAEFSATFVLMPWLKSHWISSSSTDEGHLPSLWGHLPDHWDMPSSFCFHFKSVKIILIILGTCLTIFGCPICPHVPSPRQKFRGGQVSLKWPNFKSSQVDLTWLEVQVRDALLDLTWKLQNNYWLDFDLTWNSLALLYFFYHINWHHLRSIMKCYWRRRKKFHKLCN